jgi:hypothetical protein
LLPIFGSPQKKIQNKKNQKIYSEENQKVIALNKGFRSAKKIIKNWLRRLKNTKIKI